MMAFAQILAFAIPSFLVILGLVVTIHELGHYLVMRWCGVHVLRFAFGFGKVLWSRQDRAGIAFQQRG